MGVSIQQYRQRIGCFAGVATILSSFKVRGYKRNTFSKQSKDCGTAVRVIIRLSCLVVLVAAVILSSSFVLDLTQFGDVEKNPGPKSDQNYKFHLIGPKQFEKIAVTVLNETYKIPFSIKDDDYDAVAWRVNIDLGGGNILTNQNVLVQVKHTTSQSAELTDVIRKKLFEKEKNNVKKLIAENKFDIYIIFTNYKLSSCQFFKLQEMFKDAGAKEVVVVGYETLSLWLNSSPELQRKVIRLYPRDHLTDLANCAKAVQSIQLLERYRENFNKIIDVKAFTSAKEIVESDKSLVFITGVPGSGKTTVAKQLVVQLFDKYDSYTYYNITCPNHFDKYWIEIPAEKFIFFVDDILDFDDINKWSQLEAKLKIAIEQGSKFVFAGQSTAFKEALKRSHLNDFYEYLCDGAIDLSDEQFNLSKHEKQEMLKKQVDMGDNDNSTKEALLKDDMLAHAAEINSPCFPLVASSLGSRRYLERFKTLVPTVYNQEFLDQFFKWIQSTTEDLHSSSESSESPSPKRPRLEMKSWSTVGNRDNIRVQDYKFHLIGHDEFEKFAATVLGDTYNIKALLTFSEGKDGGRDVAACGVDIDLGGGHILRNQNLVVQVKHTGKKSETITDTIRRNIFEKEKKKVEKLVKRKQLDTYIMFTNYKVPALQEEKLVECFTDAKNVGAKNLIIVGKETLSRWLNDSPELRRKVIRQYPYLIDHTAVQSIQLLERYREDLNKIIDVKAFTKAKEIVESDNGLVFITGLPGSGKTTVAKKLAVQLLGKFDSFTYYEINFPHDFDEYWDPAKKYIFFMDNMNSENMNDWNTLKDSVSDAIEQGSKFVFVGPSVAFKEASKKQRFDNFYEYLCDGAIDLSDEQFNLSKHEKQEMLKKQVDMGDNDSLTKEALLKDDMLAHATEINCPCFPLVASSLGSRRCLERFKMHVPTVYNQEFLDQFFKWIQSTTEDLHSSSESSESPSPKRPQLETKSWSTVGNRDNIRALTEVLSKEYKARASRLHPLPWVDEMQFKLDKVYTKLGIVPREKNGWQMSDKIVELSDIFDKDLGSDENPRLILIEGSPGMGKTTLSLKIAYDWAMGKMPSKFPPVQLVLLIKCRDMKGDILNAINEQLLPTDRDSLKINLSNFIKEQPGKIMLVVDGLDETPEAASKYVMDLSTRKCLQDCYVVATSRQEKGLKVRKYFDTLLESKGYSESGLIEEYVRRHFQDKNDPSLAERLIENLETNITLQTLATNPLNTVLLCVVFEEYGGKLPSTVTELYENIVFCITKRYCEKYSLKVEDTLLETLKETLGKLSYKGLLEDSLSFRESDLKALNDKTIQCTEMGFLYKEVSKLKIKQDHTYSFLHKTFQEYLAAFYFTNKFERAELTIDDIVEQLQDTTKFVQVLMFVSGMLHKKNDVQNYKTFVKKLGTVLLQRKDKNEVACILCAVLSEILVDKDIAGIIYQFLPKELLNTSYGEYVSRILPRILNLLCTKDGVNKEVYFQKLQLTYSKISTSDLGLISKAFKERLKVRILNFAGSALRDETARDLADMLFHNSTIEQLSIYRNFFTAEAAKILAGNLRQNTTLKKLHFAYNDLGDVGVKAITAALTPDTSLKGMATRNNDNDHSDREDGRRWSALHYLSLQGTNCGEQGALAVTEMLRSNDTLLQLNIPDNPLGCKGVTYIAEALKSNRTLNCLDLIQTDCSDEGAAALADMLRSNKTLGKLSISSCFNTEHVWSNKVGKDGAVALADALRDNNSLKELHLRNNDITDEGFKCLAEALLENTALEELCVEYPAHPGDCLAALDQNTRERVEERITSDCYCTYI